MVRLPSDVDAIIAMEEPALRNLLITQRYHDLSLALAEVVGGADVNWSTFATWASKTAGESIRHEEVPAFLRDLLALAAPRVAARLGPELRATVTRGGQAPVARLLVGPIRAALRAVSASIARGNLKVFAELAPEFVRFVQTFRGDAAPQPAKVDAYLARFAPGPVEAGGQDLLRSAFAAYQRAALEPDPALRARLVLLANCQVGLHEQTRLQPEIEAAMDAPIAALLRRELRAAIRASASPEAAEASLRGLGSLRDELAEEVEERWERVLTRHLLHLALPFGESIPLGHDLRRATAAQPFYPPSLATIDGPTDLVALFATYDRAHGACGAGTASVDWSDLPDRMNFIVNLFRSRQQAPALRGAVLRRAARGARGGPHAGGPAVTRRAPAPWSGGPPQASSSRTSSASNPGIWTRARTAPP
jgi:hypothetical protein